MRAIHGLIATGVRNPVLAHLLMACLVAGGFFASRRIVRESFPDFSLDHIVVEFAYPGASPEDCEAVAIQIEEAVAGLDGMGELASQASQDGGQVYIQLQSTVRDAARVLQEVKDRIDRITTFPADMKRPIVSELVYRQETISIAIAGDAPERTLRQLGLDARRDLLALPDISRVGLIGVRDEEIAIEISEEALQQYGLSLREVIAAVSRGSLDLPAGSLETATEAYTLRVKGLGSTAAAYEDLVVITRPDGTLVRLAQLASVRDGFADTAQRGRLNGKPAVLVTAFKAPGEDGNAIAAAVRNYVAEHAPRLPVGLAMSVWADTSTDLTARLNMLKDNSLQAIVLVLITLAVFLSLRLAFFVALDFPVVYAGAIALLYLFDSSLNMVTLFGLLMVAGIIVDDSNVIAEAIHARRKKGDSPELAAINGAANVAMPVLGSVAAAVAAFAPLLFVSGVMGKFIHDLPLVIIAALIISLVEAFLVLPSHLAHPGRQLDPHRSRLDRLRLRVRARLDHGIDHFIDHVYTPALDWALRRRGLAVVLSLVAVLLTVGWILGGHTPLVLLPKEDGNALKARVRFPEGAPLALISETVGRLEVAAAALNSDPSLRPAAPGDLVRQCFSLVGEWSGPIVQTSDALAEVQIELMSTETRRVDSERIIARWRELTGPVPDALAFTFERQQPGPTHKPIEVRLHADDLDVLRTAADKLRDELAATAGVTELEDDLLPGRRELRVSLKPHARSLGLTLEDLGRQLRQAFYGGEAVSLFRDREEVKVQVRYPKSDRRSLADLESMRLRTAAGDAIPFLEAADVDVVRGVAVLRHQNGQRRARVWADIDEERANAEQIINHLKSGFLPNLVASTPGLRYSIGGEYAQIRESMSSLWTGYIVSILAIYAIMAGLLGSYIQPLIIMATVPLGLTGAVVGHAVMGRDLTLMSLFGVVALTGVVVNNAIVMLDEVNKLRADGLSVARAIREGARSRFRPVTSTAITTIVGLLPMLTERSSQAQSLVPMAISLDFGLVFATVLTLLVVPAVHLFTNDLRRLARWLRRGGEYPTPEAVEHARHEHELMPAG